MENIRISNDEGIEKEYDIIFEFTSNNDNKHYIVYTDYTKDENNIIKCYSSIYEDDVLLPVTGKEEIAYIDSMLASIEAQANLKYKIIEE